MKILFFRGGLKLNIYLFYADIPGIIWFCHLPAAIRFAYGYARMTFFLQWIAGLRCLDVINGLFVIRSCAWWFVYHYLWLEWFVCAFLILELGWLWFFSAKLNWCPHLAAAKKNWYSLAVWRAMSNTWGLRSCIGCTQAKYTEWNCCVLDVSEDSLSKVEGQPSTCCFIFLYWIYGSRARQLRPFWCWGSDLIRHRRLAGLIDSELSILEC